MSANIDAVLARLDEMNNGEINYEVYRELHDLVSAIEDDVQAPIELFPGTLEALDALSIRARTTSPDAATEELDKVTLDRLQELAEERGYDKGFAAGWKSGGRTADLLAPKLRKAQAERDAALAAVERVRAEADAYAEQPDVMEPCGAVAQALRTALDGAPEPAGACGAGWDCPPSEYHDTSGFFTCALPTGHGGPHVDAKDGVRWNHDGYKHPDLGTFTAPVAVLDGAPEVESRWEYRGRLQSCGYVAEGYISAEYAMNGLRVELEDHPYLAMDDTAIVERARVREWLPVEGEKP